MQIRTLTIFAAATLMIGFATSSASAVTLTGLFNTGVDATGAALPGGDGVLDPHYIVSSSGLAGIAVGSPTYTYYNPAYVADSATSRWISYSGSPFISSGAFAVSTTFDLTGYDPTSASLSGLWGTDNDGEIFLNGVTTGITLTGSSQNNFNQLHAFSISSGFVAGINTLSVSVFDSGPPAAVRVDSLVGTATVATVPEPASWTLMIAGFAMSGAALRRRNGFSAAA